MKTVSKKEFNELLKIDYAVKSQDGKCEILAMDKDGYTVLEEVKIK